MQSRHLVCHHRPPARRRRLATLAAVAALCLAAGAGGQELALRQPLAKEAVRALALPPGTPAALAAGAQHRLIVKFRDEVKARTANGSLISLTAADIGAAEDLARDFGMIFAPLIDLPEEQLLLLEERAAERSMRAQPDLAGMLKVELPGAGPAELEAAGAALQTLPEVEFAYVQTLGVPPPNDIPPTTPDYTGLQTYFGPDPGMDVDFAWSQGFRGSGIRLSDAEYAWNYAHEDLHKLNLHPEPGQTIHPDSIALTYDEHGTAVLGQTSADVNGYGVDGMVPEASVYTFPERSVEEDYRRVAAVTAAIAGSSAGDVVLLEMQTVGPGGHYAPAELDPAVWTAVKTGTDAGVVVVAAAGNGNQDLDSPPYAEYLSRGDSGAIIVGAGTSDTNHDKLGFSTFGSRVDLQGWGENVFTLGYGHFIAIGGDKNQRYTDVFGGTSSASPFVAAAAVILEDAADSSLSPQDLRDLLIQTGVPQGSGGHIGPFVDLRAALEAYFGGNNPPVCQDDDFTTAQDTPISILFNTDLLPNDSDPDGDRLWVDDHDTTTAQGGSNSNTSPFGFVYTPPGGFTGLDWFDYTITDRSDGSGLYDTCTVTVDVLAPTCDPVFADGFDSGGFGSWSSTAVTGNATLAATSEAAMEGPFGMEVTVAGAGDHAFVRDQSPAAETTYRARFLFRFDALMSSGNLHRLMSIQDASPAANVVLVEMRKSGLLYQVRAMARRDNYTWAATSWVDVASQKAPTSIEVLWRAADAGQSNGSLDFTVDGQTQSLTGIDNDGFQVDRVYLGVVNGTDAGTTGAFQFDGFESCRD